MHTLKTLLRLIKGANRGQELKGQPKADRWLNRSATALQVAAAVARILLTLHNW
ncbi:hypothetical protein [Streptomyces sp. NRRL B-24484]|uniref:hypothetical protein n=1 Tax=Streptomyces sp. NRRL B-24484 TaxID=1463833 RepID=UPI0013319657|nr:hypothetical protein [Streptomyces sp. NRRL B-24484]